MGIKTAFIKFNTTDTITKVKKTYVTPSVAVYSLEPYGFKMEQLIGDVCNIKKVLDFEKFFGELIGYRLGKFNKLKMKQAFVEKAKSSNITLAELKNIIDKVGSQKQIFINLTDPLGKFKLNGIKIPRPLDFKEAEFVLEKGYSPENISKLTKVRDIVINGEQILIKDAGDIVENNITEGYIKRYLTIKKNADLDFDSSESLYATYLKDTEIPVFKNLVRKQGLTKNEAIVSILNGFSEKQNRVLQDLIRRFNLSETEAALCTKLEMQRSEINKFLEIKGREINYTNEAGKVLRYTLPSEEAIYCAKYGFDDSKLQRFAKLKNEYFAQESIRSSGFETNFAVNDILEWIKKDATNQDIFNYNYFLNNPQLFKYFTEKELENISSWLVMSTKFKIKPEFEQIAENGIGQRILNGAFLFEERINQVVKAVDKEENMDNLFLEIKKFVSESIKLNEDERIFNNCIKVANELKTSSNLSQYELDFLDRVLSLQYKESEGLGKNLLSNMKLVFDYKLQSPEQISRYKSLIDAGVRISPEHFAGDENLYSEIMRLAKSEPIVYEDSEGNLQKLDIDKIALLAQFIDITKFDIKLLFQNNLNKWYKVCTGENEEVHKLFKYAGNLLKNRKREVVSNLKEEHISNIRKLDKSGTYGNRLMFDEYNNLVFMSGKDSFKVAAEKVAIGGKPVILVKDLQSDSYYIAVDGAITKFNSSTKTNREKLSMSLFGFSKYSKKQDEIYTQAIENFPVKITNDSSECIMGKGIQTKSFRIKPIDFCQTDNELVEQYKNALNALKEKEALTVENILRIMPKFSTVQINPYTTGKSGKMLYSVSAEWKSKDGVKWQLRTHSTDLEHYTNSVNNAENADWIFRLGHEIADGETKFFEFNGKENPFTGNFMGSGSKLSHVQIPISPFEQGNLLGNIHFQNIMRQISENFVEQDVVGNLAKELGINLKGNAIRQRIVEESFSNPLFYLKNKNQIDILRKDLGLDIH